MKHPFKLIGSEIKIITEEFLRYSPGTMGAMLRCRYWRGKYRRCGKHLSIDTGVIIKGAENMELGDHVSFMGRDYVYAHNNGLIRIGDWASININVQINAADGGKITIGNNVLVGPNVVIRASNHVYERKDIPIRRQGHSGGEIIIEDDVWIGANAVILPDVNIGKGAVVAAGAVVTSDIAPYRIVGGVPAKVISSRKT